MGGNERRSGRRRDGPPFLLLPVATAGADCKPSDDRQNVISLIILWCGSNGIFLPFCLSVCTHRLLLLLLLFLFHCLSSPYQSVGWSIPHGTLRRSRSSSRFRASFSRLRLSFSLTATCSCLSMPPGIDPLVPLAPPRPPPTLLPPFRTTPLLPLNASCCPPAVGAKNAPPSP